MIGILTGLGSVVFAMFIIFLKGDNIKDYGGALFIIGIVTCLASGLLSYKFDIDEKINNTIKTTINANYDNVVNFHNDEDNKTFISGNSKYAFEYNEDSKTLTILKGSDVDAVFVDGIKKDNK